MLLRQDISFLRRKRKFGCCIGNPPHATPAKFGNSDQFAEIDFLCLVAGFVVILVLAAEKEQHRYFFHGKARLVAAEKEMLNIIDKGKRRG